MSVWEPISFAAQPITPQTEGQMERVNQIIKDMLRACVQIDGRSGTSTFH
jgi:hypothetical protein